MAKKTIAKATTTKAAKTTAKEAAKPAEESNGPGKGKKLCPKCDTVNGAATRKCTNPECGYVFAANKAAKKTAARKAGKSGASSWADDINTKVQAAVEYIKQVGSVEEGERVLRRRVKIT